jgi:DMSO/TMAO reductase YedYZ heme-binding membrane subunit
MDMNFAILVAMGFLTSVVMSGLFQTVTAVVRRRVGEKPTRR